MNYHRSWRRSSSENITNVHVDRRLLRSRSCSQRTWMSPPRRLQCELQSERLIRALSLGRGDGRWTSKRRPCITGTEFRVWYDPGAATRRVATLASPERAAGVLGL